MSAEWRAGAAEGLPLEDASIDAAFVAEAFRWFDTRGAVAELARVLRPGGALVVLFDDWDAPYDPPLPEEATRAIAEVGSRTGPAGRPKVERGEWRRGFDGSPFAPFERRRELRLLVPEATCTLRLRAGSWA